MTIEEARKEIIESGIELGAGDFVELEALKVAADILGAAEAVRKLNQQRYCKDCESNENGFCNAFGCIKKIKAVTQENDKIEMLTALDIVASLPSLYPMMQPFEEEAIHSVVASARNAYTDWIPCSSGKLPEEPEEKINSIDDAQEAARLGIIKEYCVMIKDAELPTVLCYAGDGYWYDEATNDWYSVIAWRELPEPYRPEGE